MSLKDVHVGLSLPDHCGEIYLCSGYSYFHYLCDGMDDRGWGCGYRTLQTLCSWIQQRLTMEKLALPTIPQIQEILVAMGDKDEKFLKSRQWIGSVEVGLVIDKLYNVPCKLLHLRSGAEIVFHVNALKDHFSLHQSPAMMGGESDTSSKGIIGLATSSTMQKTYLLILDPHYYCNSKHEQTTPEMLQEAEWVKWMDINSFHQDTFYNICLPQTKQLLRTTL